MAIGQTAIVPVTINNVGQGIFSATSSTPVDLGYHWYDQAGKLVVWDGLRTKMPADLQPGASVLLQAQVQSPPDGGTYQLRFDLAQEGVAWFSSKGTPTGNITVSVCCTKQFGATYRRQFMPLAVSGAAATVPITLTNTGNFPWNVAGTTPVHLGYHWVTSA